MKWNKNVFWLSIYNNCLSPVAKVLPHFNVSAIDKGTVRLEESVMAVSLILDNDNHFCSCVRLVQMEKAHHFEIGLSF